MISQGFWPSLNGDRKYGVTDWENFHSLFIGNGVFSRVPTSLQVTIKDHMTVNVGIGAGFINGKHIVVTEIPEELNITTASGVYDRITRIILRANSLTRSMEFIAVDGNGVMPGNTPIAPSLVRNEVYYDLALADVAVNKNTIELTNSMVTDLRPNSDLCGWVSGLFAQFEADDLFSQFGSIFNTWFTHLENELTSNQAANLQLQIDRIRSCVGEVKCIACASPPVGWLLCHGQVVSKTSYSELFNAIGYSFGGSDDSFSLPDLRDRTIIGASSTHELANVGGAEKSTISLTTLNTPPHTHPATGTVNITAYKGYTTAYNVRGDSDTSNSSNHAYTVATTVTTAGSGDPFDVPIVQPYAALNYIIYTGVFN